MKLLIPVSVLVKTIDFYFAEQDKTKGHSDLFYLSKITSSIIELPETVSFLTFYPVFKLKISILPSLVPKTHKFGLKVKQRKEQTNETLVKVF
jgi:hypothetical protein